MGTTTWRYTGSRSSARVETGTVTSPAVMLSPKAMKFVRASSGGADTVSGKVQLADLAAASVAVHVTGVVPMAKTWPDVGVHVRLTGD